MSSPQATVLFGVLFGDGDHYESDASLRPWARAIAELGDVDYDYDEVLAVLDGWRPVPHVSEADDPAGHAVWSANLDILWEHQKTCPVEFVRYGYESDGGFALALRESVQSVDDYGTAVFEHNIDGSSEWVLKDWVERLGMTEECTAPAWIFFATEG